MTRAPIIALLAATALLYLWDLGANGWGNEFYAAAVQAGTQDWTALFFGSLDPGNTVTVDKPPAALWLMALSGRVFGFSPWSMLVPQALAGVASVWLLYAAVRRWSGQTAGLLAGAALAATPVAALMFRFNNPDALLTLLLVAAGYCTVRATEKGSGRWLALAGVAVGFGFLTKMLQAMVVLPALALVYLIAAPIGLGRRVLHVAGAGAAVAVAAGWYIAVADLWPADSRPYIGGSTDDSVLDLALGYNGLGRVFGGGGNPSGSGPGTAFGGETGWGRMLGLAFGSEVAWLLPAALIGLVAGLWFTRWAPRTDRTRAALLLWGGWTLVTAAVFSFMQGITHPYYAVALAPGIAGVAGVAGWELWRGRDHTGARITLAGIVVVTAGWSFVLLLRDPDWQPWLRWAVGAVGLAAGTAIAVGAHRTWRVGALAIVACLGATTAYTVATAVTPHGGSIPMSGPARASDAMPMRPDADPELVAALRATDTRWAAATTGAGQAGALQLASGRPVIGIGGFSGADPAPTLAEFQRHVADGAIRYYVGEGGGRSFAGPGGGAIADWVAATFTPATIGDHTVYDLARPRSG
ncbi:glycosyltransferase family 39 protein [Actinokineospora fastidiosa]|uniref:Glycosyl transferase n=1 Tax=Actinokineospora fastidiosa TaxID=1816 RepID=A0A918GGX3_9PSEU|nr:glycosyltransferase family 39 protein [Actinokineospora fastidiosa]GGS31779.1 glycosyl transferase [Actinokineospora fastidiosa]